MGTPFSWCGVGWGGMGRDVWTEAKGLREAGNRWQWWEGEKPRTPAPEGGPTLLPSDCAQGARPEIPHPHPSQVKQTHSLGAALHSLMRLTSQTADCWHLPSTRCPPLEPRPAPQDHQGPLSEEDWESPGLGPWGRRDILEVPGLVAGHPGVRPREVGEGTLVAPAYNSHLDPGAFPEAHQGPPHPVTLRENTAQ